MPDLQALLDQIQQIERHTRSGPWEPHPIKDSQMYATYVVGPEADTLEPEIAAVVSGFDAQFIALARTALPQLAKAVKSVLDLLEHRAHHSKAFDPTGEFWAILDAYDQAIRQVITDALGDTMTDLPGYYMPHCTNCYATSHSVHNCPYNDEGDDDDD